MYIFFLSMIMVQCMILCAGFVLLRVECDHVSTKIRTILEELCEDVQPFVPFMCVASCFATVTLALTAHIQCALEKGWTLPDISRY